MSYDISNSRGTTLLDLIASAPTTGFVKSQPAIPVKTPSFKAPKVIGKKPAIIAKGKKEKYAKTTDGPLKPLKDKKIKQETDDKVQAPDDLARARGKAPDKNGEIIVAGGPGSGRTRLQGPGRFNSARDYAHKSLLREGYEQKGKPGNYVHKESGAKAKVTDEDVSYSDRPHARITYKD